MKLQMPATRKARIEMLPLIDIVFLLLVFFIYAMLSMAVHRSLPVQLPASNAAEVDKGVQRSITVKADGTVYLDTAQVAMEALGVRLKADVGAGKNGVLLFADRSVSYQQLFKVLDRINQAGIASVSLQAERERPGP